MLPLSLQRGREEYLPGAGFPSQSRSNLLAEPSASWLAGWVRSHGDAVGQHENDTQGSECADIEDKDWGGGGRRGAEYQEKAEEERARWKNLSNTTERFRLSSARF